MPNLKCWPGATCQITDCQRNTDLVQLLGRIVKVVQVAGTSIAGPVWQLQKPQQIRLTKPTRFVMTGNYGEVGQTASFQELPDAWLTPFPDLDESDEALEDCEIDLERSFEAQEPQHA